MKINDKEGSFIAYPPGTEFILKDESGYIIFKETSDPDKYNIKEGRTLVVYPDYKKSKDTYHLEEGMLELAKTKYWSDMLKDHYQENEYTHGLTSNKTYSNSSKFPGRINVVITFSNGVVFTYNDGKYNATQNGKYIHIEGKYLIYAEEGVIKLSYNSESGTVWWGFDSK